MRRNHGSFCAIPGRYPGAPSTATRLAVKRAECGAQNHALTFPRLPLPVVARHEFSQMIKLDRRLLLAALSASLLPHRAFAVPAAGSGIRLGPPKDFSFASLAARAKTEAGQPYKAPQARP